MRIAVLCSSHPVNDEHVTYRLAMSLVSFGYDVTVMGRRAGDSYQPIHPKLTLVPLLPQSRGFISRLRMYGLLYRRGMELRPDAVACFGPGTALVGLALKWRLRAKLVFEVIECYDGLAKARLGGRLGSAAGFAVRVLLRIIARRSDWVCVVSPVTMEQYSRYRKDNHISLIHNSSRVEWFAMSDGVIRDDGAEPFVCCWLGESLQRRERSLTAPFSVLVWSSTLTPRVGCRMNRSARSNRRPTLASSRCEIHQTPEAV